MFTHSEHPCDDLDGTSSHSCVLNARFRDSRPPKYFICVEPDLKITARRRFIVTKTTKQQTEENAPRIWSDGEAKQAALLIQSVHMIHQSDYFHRADHHLRVWESAFHEQGLLTSAPLEINLCVLINHTLLMQHPSLMRCGEVQRCLVDLGTKRVAFHQHCSFEVWVHKLQTDQAPLSMCVLNMYVCHFEGKFIMVVKSWFLTSEL